MCIIVWKSGANAVAEQQHFPLCWALTTPPPPREHPTNNRDMTQGALGSIHCIQNPAHTPPLTGVYTHSLPFYIPSLHLLLSPPPAPNPTRSLSLPLPPSLPYLSPLQGFRIHFCMADPDPKLHFDTYPGTAHRGKEYNFWQETVQYLAKVKC